MLMLIPGGVMNGIIGWREEPIAENWSLEAWRLWHVMRWVVIGLEAHQTQTQISSIYGKSY